jgi:predicted Fe-Mo cluster-binding NifX family protein
MKMKVAITVWNNRISPVMDTARQLLVVNYEQKQEVSREVVSLPQFEIARLAAYIADLGIDILICGAISKHFEVLLANSKIELQAWIGGDLEDVLAAFRRGELNRSRYNLPGRIRQRTRGRSRYRGHKYYE